MTQQEKVMREVLALRRQASRRLDELLKESRTVSTPTSPSSRQPEQRRGPDEEIVQRSA